MLLETVFWTHWGNWLLSVCKLEAGNSPHPGPRSLWEKGLRMSFQFHRLRCSCQGQGNGKARWKGPDVCRNGGADGAKAGGLAVAAGEISVGRQKSCHPQIIKKIKTRNSEIGQSLNERSQLLLKLSCLERVYQKKKPSVKISCVVFLEPGSSIQTQG